jgi:arsenical-resistance protein 2
MDKIPWYSHFPSPHSKPQSITHDAVAKLIQDPEKLAGKDYIIVDVRRTDFDVLSLLSTDQT